MPLKQYIENTGVGAFYVRGCFSAMGALWDVQL